jgi:hypothetical protein
MKKQIAYTALPPECITFQKREYWLDQRIQLTPLGKEIRYSGIRLNEERERIWVWRDGYRVEKSHWIYTFVYLDGSGLLEFECDYNDKIKMYARISSSDAD